MEICEGFVCGPVVEEELAIASPLVGGSVGDDEPGRYVVVSPEGLGIFESMEGSMRLLQTRPLQSLGNGASIDVLSVRRNRTGSVVGLVEKPTAGWVVLAWADGERLAVHRSQLLEAQRRANAKEMNTPDEVNRRVEVEKIKLEEMEGERQRIEIKRQVDRQVKMELEKEWKERAAERKMQQKQQVSRESQLKVEVQQMTEQLQRQGERSEREKQLHTELNEMAERERQLKLQLQRQERGKFEPSPGIAMIFGLTGDESAADNVVQRKTYAKKTVLIDAADAQPCICVCQ